MTTIYLQKNRGRRRSGLWLPLFSTLIIATILAVLLLLAPRFSSSTGSVVARPLWVMRSFIGSVFGNAEAFVRTRHSLLEENKRLKAELDSARANTMFYDAVALEHKKILEAFGRTETLVPEDRPNRMLATVLAKPPQSPYDTIVLDLGQKDGVVSGDTVYSFGNIIVGRITSVNTRTSSAALFSSAGTETPAVVERSDLAIVLTGRGGGSFEARVPQDADIVLGDVIVVPHITPAIIGRVVNVEATPSSSFKQISVQSPVNVNHIRWVEII